MDTRATDHSVASATFQDVRQLEITYAELMRAGLSSGDVSVLVTEEAYAARPKSPSSGGLFDHLALVQGGFTGGIQMKALGPARSFGVTGSVATGLMQAGMDDAEAAWLMNSLAEGRGVILVHASGVASLKDAHRVLEHHGGQRFVAPPSRPSLRRRGVAKRSLSAVASAAPGPGTSPSHPE